MNAQAPPARETSAKWSDEPDELFGWIPKPALEQILKAGLRERFDHATQLIEYFKAANGAIILQLGVTPPAKAQELAEIIRELKPELLTILAGNEYTKKHFSEYEPKDKA